MPRQCEWCMPTSRKCRRSFDRSARADSSLNAASNFCGRSAFSLLELVVVVGVVGLLLGLMLPAIQYAREAARRHDCQSRLHQFGVALHDHHGQFGRLPKDGLNGYGLGVFLLPQFEQTALYDGIRPLQTERDSYQVPGGDAALPVFRCPSDDDTDRIAASGLGRSNYIGSAEMFSRFMELTDVLDGESNTIALGETVSDHAWPLPGLAESVPPGQGGRFSGRHRSGTLFLFCDGAVKFIRNDVDATTFGALCTPAGNDVPGEF